MTCTSSCNEHVHALCCASQSSAQCEKGHTAKHHRSTAEYLTSRCQGWRNLHNSGRDSRTHFSEPATERKKGRAGNPIGTCNPNELVRVQVGDNDRKRRGYCVLESEMSWSTKRNKYGGHSQLPA